VEIDLNRSYPAGAWEVLTSSAGNTGSYNWTVTGAVSTTSRIRVHGVTQTSAGDTSNGNFTIASSGGGGATITITLPNGGEIARVNSFFPLRWTAVNAGASPTVLIQLNRSYPNGAWETLNYSAANMGYYTWPVNGASTSQARIRIIASNNSAVGDTSNGNFTISATVSGDGPVASTATLESAYPNPFNPSTQIRFQLTDATQVKLEVFDVSGRLVATLLDAPQESGAHAVTLDGTNLSTGLYFVRMQAGSVQSVQKIQLLK